MTPERYNEISDMFNAYIERHGRITAHFILMDVGLNGKVDVGDEECQEDVDRIIQETGLTIQEIHDWSRMHQEELEYQVELDMDDHDFHSGMFEDEDDDLYESCWEEEGEEDKIE